MLPAAGGPCAFFGAVTGMARSLSLRGALGLTLIAFLLHTAIAQEDTLDEMCDPAHARSPPTPHASFACSGRAGRRTRR